jgi:hypothetical protein
MVLGDYASDLQDAAERGEAPAALAEHIVREFERVRDAVKNLRPD